MAKVAAETVRLRLRDWGDGDEAKFYDVMNRAPVMRHLGGLQTREEWHAAFARIQGFTRDFGHTFWIIEDRGSGDILGFCGLKRVNAPGAGALSGTAEIGWRLRESAWGRGIAKEAAIASFDLGFGRFGYDEIVALTVDANTSSHGLMRRLGMRRRADLDFVDTRHGPDLNPQMVFALAAADWPAARAAALS